MGAERPIYLDYQATTPCDPRVVAAMLPWWSESFGNAASKTHAFGWEAAEAVERARGEIARLIGADAREIVFTSGATEANNLALLGSARAPRGGRDRVIALATEHRSVLDPLARLERESLRVTRLEVRRDGLVDLERLRAALDERVLWVSAMHANNEIGVIQDMASIARAAHAVGALVHCDAAQSAGQIPVDVRALGVDLLTLSGHKLYGPKGIGALWLRRRPPLALEPLLYGGGHERGLRSGTLPVPLCVGLGEAARIAGAEREAEAQRARALRDRLWQRIASEIPGAELNGHAEQRLPGNLNVALPVEASALLAALPGLALSTGSACTSAVPEPSHVLRALGLDRARALGSIRIAIGRPTTAGEIERAADLLAAAAARLRGTTAGRAPPAIGPPGRWPGGGERAEGERSDG
jgi:cysteine desulfurase